MTVAVQMPQGGGLAEDILKGLNIAQTIFGIKADKAKYEQMAEQEKQKQALAQKKMEQDDADRSKKDAAEAYAAEGGLTIPQEHAYLEKGWKIAENGDGPIKGWVMRQGIRTPAAFTPPAKEVSGGFSPFQQYQKEQDEKKAVVDARKSYKADVNKTEDSLKAAASAKQLAATSTVNPNSASALVRQLARLSGDTGVLSDQDTKSFAGSQALADKLKRTIASYTRGTLPPEDAKLAAEFIETMESELENYRFKNAMEYARSHTLIYEGDLNKNYEKITSRKMGDDAKRIGELSKKVEETIAKRNGGGLSVIDTAIAGDKNQQEANTGPVFQIKGREGYWRRSADGQYYEKVEQ